MKFQSISIRNFRLFPELDLDFSTDPEKNVTILIGDNGSGKTTLAQAFIGVYLKTINSMINFGQQVLFKRLTKMNQ